MAKKARGWRERTDHLLRHPVIATVVGGLLLLAITAIVAEIAWSAPTGVLGQKVRVWPALLVGMLAAVVLVAALRRPQRLPAPRQRYIRKFGVDWPITPKYGLGTRPTIEGFWVERPVCPRDRTPLSLHNQRDDKIMVVTDERVLEKLRPPLLAFACTADGCDGKYDLNGFGGGVEDMMHVVENEALGQYRSRR